MSNYWFEHADIVYLNINQAINEFLDCSSSKDYSDILFEIKLLSENHEFISVISNNEMKYEYAFGGRAINLNEFIQLKESVECYKKNRNL